MSNPASNIRHSHQQTGVLGIIATDLSNLTHISIIEGAQAEASKWGYPLLISGDAGRGPSGEPTHFPFGDWQRVVGTLVVHHGAENDTCDFFTDLPSGLSVVTTGYAGSRQGVGTVEIDRRQGAREATEYLVSLGHRRIAYITSPLRLVESRDIRRGYLEALRETRISPDDSLMAVGDGSSAGGYRATAELLDRKVGFTALFAQNDQMAIGALRAFYERELRVPHDVAVIGFDDISFAQYCVPPLTTVHCPFYELGQAGIQLLVDMIGNKLISSTVNHLESRLIIRHSCGSQSTSWLAH